jgi:hypothetical protein
VGSVPEEIRGAVRVELDLLTQGQLPDLLVWINGYGRNGATHVRQPEAIWEHEQADALRTPDGSWLVVVPLFTTDESPSDLSAEIVVAPDGRARIEDFTSSN